MIREILVVTSTYAARPYTLLVVGEGGGGWGWGEGIRCQPVGGRSMLYSLGGKSYDAIVQPAFFLAGNCARNGMPIVVAFKNLFTLNSLRML